MTTINPTPYSSSRSVSPPSRGGTGRGPSPAGLPPRFWLIGTMVLLGLDIVGATIDAIFIKTPLDIVIGSGGNLGSLLAAIGVALLAAYLMLDAGYLGRNPAASGHSPTRIRVIICVWLGLGLGLVVIRVAAALLTVRAAHPAGAFAQPDTTGRDVVVGVVLLVVYIAAGALSYNTGRLLTDWELAAHMLDRIGLDRLERQVEKARAHATRPVELVEIAAGDLDAVDALEESQRVIISAFGDELMAYAKLRMAQRIGDPAATGIAAIPPAAVPRLRSPFAALPTAREDR